MCGITAILALKDSAGSSYDCHANHDILAKDIDNSLEIVKHRGPDARGQWISAARDVGLGHVRLSIIDLSPEGNQPFHDSQDELHAVVNGELYDHERYRAELAREYQFTGHSDCEIVLALYKHYGLSFISHLRGEFAFVLWDSKRQLLIAARDRYGIKSLYYTILDGRLLVATEMKSFLAFGWKPEWDVQSVCDSGWRLDTRTMFKGVRKVLPGHYLISKRHAVPEESPYWDLEYPNKRVKETRSEEEMIAGVRERLLEAVRLRLRADVPVGILLSGGLDSSAVAGMVAHLMKEGTKLGDERTQHLSRMKVFTVQFDKDSGIDESDIAQRTANWLGVSFHPVVLDETAIATRLEDVVWYTETVIPDANGMGRLAMAEVVHAEGTKVVLSGEGSDEHFGGYTSFQADALREADHSWLDPSFSDPERQKAFLAAEQQDDVTNFGGTTNARSDSTVRMLNNTNQGLRQSALTPLDFAAWAVKAYPDVNQETVIAESFNGQVRDAMANKWHPLHTAEYVWTKSTFPNILLRYIGDNVDMVHHVESRVPFLDHHVTEYANNIPPSLKIKYDPVEKKFNEKYILKQAMRPFITDEIYKRKKHPFIGPSQFKQGGPLHKVLARLVTKENVEQLGFLSWDKTKGLLDKAFVDKDRFAVRKAICVAQFVALGQRFGVKRAEPDHAINGATHNLRNGN